MSDYDNPYKSPETNTQVMNEIVSQEGLTEEMLKNLSQASPWLRFMGIIGFISSGFMALLGFLSIGMAPLFNSLLDEFEEIFSFFSGFGVITFLYAVYFLGFAAILFFPALFTYRFGAKINNYIRNSSPGDLELAFKNNKMLWQFKGILTIIGLAFIPVIIIISIIAVVALAAFF
jgi:hypothetical protein